MAKKDEPEVQSPKEVASQNQELVEKTNSNVDKAGEEAAKSLEGQTSETFNTIDAVLGNDEQHGIDVKTAQAASFGEEYDPKTDPEAVIIEITPVASQNQNNLKHPSSDEFTDPMASKTYLGHPL